MRISEKIISLVLLGLLILVVIFHAKKQRDIAFFQVNIEDHILYYVPISVVTLWVMSKVLLRLWFVMEYLSYLGLSGGKGWREFI